MAKPNNSYAQGDLSIMLADKIKAAARVRVLKLDPHRVQARQ
jgi:hypothetical protein